MHTMIKQEKMTPQVKRYVDLWDSLSEDGKFALDMAVYDMLVMDIDLHRKEILEEAERLHKAHVKKVYRAAAKTVLAKHRKGEHDQKDHGNWAKQTASFISESLGRDKGPEQLSLFGPDTNVKPKDGQWKIISSLATLPERITTAGESVAEGMKEFLKGSTWGERILSGAAYLARGTNLVAEAAKVMVVYGPFVGARMIAAYFRHGGYDVPVPEPGSGKGAPMKRGKDESLEAFRQRQRNWAVNRFKDQLPDRQTMELSAGKAPSEGYIISKSGEVIAHAVGRGNDHYLPFGLKHLRLLRQDEGGEIVRRRALGGVTQEDIRAAMRLGADKVTVVSNSGVFTLDLTERAKGLRSEYTQILSRYHDLLRREARGRNGNEWNFTTYNNAMKALALEFPLHFNVGKNTSGEHPQMGDLNHPKKTILQEFRDMFGADDRKSQSQTGMSASSVQREFADLMGKAGARPPARLNYEEAREWFIRNATDEQKRKYNSLVNPKTEPDNTRQSARRIIDPSRPIGYTTPPQDQHRTVRSAESVINTFSETPRRNNPVQVTQTKDQTPAQRQAAIEDLRRRQAEVRSKLDEEIAEYASANDPAIAWMQANGYEPDVDEEERGRVLDGIDYAEDDDSWPYKD